MLHRRFAGIVALAVVIPLALTGCGSSGLFNLGGGWSFNATPTPTETPVETAVLTGVTYPLGTNHFLSGPAVMGKVDNAPDARPQNALNQADIVFEEMVEGGMTRFLAIWQSNLPETFGPVRSVRPMDPDLAAPFGGIINFSGGQKPFVKAMEATDVFVANETNQQGKHTFERVHDRIAPHNVMVHAQVEANQHKNIKAPSQQFFFASNTAQATANKGGKAVTDFTVTFPAGKPTWTWNAKASAWLRSQYSEKETDATDKKQLHATNVVVLKTKIDRSFKDYKYGYVPRTIVIGGGAGYVFSGGKKIEVTFKKTKQTDPIRIIDKNGKDVKLAPGNTWIELMPADVGSIEINYAKVPATASATPSSTK